MLIQTPTIKISFFVFLALGLAFVLGLTSFPSVGLELEGKPLAGAWKHQDGYYFITYWGDDPYLIESETGVARKLSSTDGIQFTYGPSRSTAMPVMGGFVLEEDVLSTAIPNQDLKEAERVFFPFENFVVQNGDKATLHGSLILPKNSQPKALILFLNGEGPNDRGDMLPTALAMLTEGYAVAVFDQRGAGASTGQENKGLYYERSMEAASDALAVSLAIGRDSRFSQIPFGVAGWSQGGWLGAVLANQDPNIEFYINIAGNSSPEAQQWRHAMITWLYRKNVSGEEIAKAVTYFDVFFAVMLGQEEWQDYKIALDLAKEEEWFPVMRQRYFAEWESKEEALEFFQKEYSRSPEDDFRDLTIPALGIFFQFDQSSPPNTPEFFLRGVNASKSPEVSVHILPGLNHGSWGWVNGYGTPSLEIGFRSVEVNLIMSHWIEGVLSDRP